MNGIVAKHNKFSSWKDLQVTFRRSATLQEVLQESLNMLLACVHELREYGLYLRSMPAKAACLVVAGEDEAKQQIVNEIRDEWGLILHMENDAASSKALHGNCRHVLHQQLREICTVLEKNEWALEPECVDLATAWFPPFACSANLECIFAEMQSAIKTANKQEGGSMASLMAVAIRSLSRRVCVDEHAPTPLQLEDADWEGKVAEGLKSKLWCPGTASPCSLTNLS